MINYIIICNWKVIEMLFINKENININIILIIYWMNFFMINIINF